MNLPKMDHGSIHEAALIAPEIAKPNRQNTAAARSAGIGFRLRLFFPRSRDAQSWSVPNGQRAEQYHRPKMADAVSRTTQPAIQASPEAPAATAAIRAAEGKSCQDGTIRDSKPLLKSAARKPETAIPSTLPAAAIRVVRARRTVICFVQAAILWERGPKQKILV
jgi:hypothetical protein